MRKLLTVLFVAVALIACDKDKDPVSASIVGKWNITTAKVNLNVGGQSAKDYLVSLGMSEEEAQQTIDEATNGINADEEFNGTFEFKADGTWIATTVDDGGTDTGTGTWKLSDDRKTLTLTDDEQSNEDGDEGPAGPQTANVVVLTETDLQLDIASGSDSQIIPLDLVVSVFFKRITP